jgi:hypothetical protein
MYSVSILAQAVLQQGFRRLQGTSPEALTRDLATLMRTVGPRDVPGGVADLRRGALISGLSPIGRSQNNILRRRLVHYPR